MLAAVDLIADQNSPVFVGQRNARKARAVTHFEILFSPLSLPFSAAKYSIVSIVRQEDASPHIPRFIRV